MKSNSPDLFSSQNDHSREPLAARMRPRIIEEFVGQSHIMAPGRLLRRAIQADQLSSVIFAGPPGTGKTTLARVIANSTKSAFLSLNAVLSGVKDVREAIGKAKKQRELYGRRTILFVDEVHRWNKAQQDALLPWVENGTIILIGATTENPFFEVNPALVSRSRIFQLKTLSKDDLMTIAHRALEDQERGYGSYNIEMEEGALDHLVKVSDGDARILLNAIELAVETSPEHFPPQPGEKIRIGLEEAEDSIQRKVVLYDKEGDYHFDVISAFIKSLRGSDPDAALYWMARMVSAGEDPRFIFRRMLILASEDVGMADPQALIVVESASAAFDRVGMPEGNFHLAHAALYLATCSKSNSSLAFFDALKTVEEEPDRDVPVHLRDANRDKEGFGHGKGYLYPHSYRDHWIEQQYLPSALQGRIFYQPSNIGFEKEIGDTISKRRELQLASMSKDENDEILTFSAPSKTKDRWLRRISKRNNENLDDIRKRIFEAARLKRHQIVLIIQEGDGLLLWEALRQVPEGMVYALVPNPEKLKVLKHFSESMDNLERPKLLQRDILSFDIDSISVEGLQTKAGTTSDLNSPEANERQSISAKNQETQESEKQQQNTDVDRDPQHSIGSQSSPKGAAGPQEGEGARHRSRGADILQDGNEDKKPDHGQADVRTTDILQGEDKGPPLHSMGKRFLFEAVIGKDFLKGETDKLAVFKKASDLLKRGGMLSIAESIPFRAMRLSSLIKLTELSKDIQDRFRSLEEALYNDPKNPKVNWDVEDLRSFASQAGFSEIETAIIEYREERSIGREELQRWLNTESEGMSYGRLIRDRFSSEEERKIRDVLTKELTERNVEWKRYYVFLNCVNLL